MEKFHDRREAGAALAKELISFAKKPDTLVLALPRGGVPVAYEIAQKLSLPLDVMIVRKLGVPGHAELAMGAIASGGTTVFNQEIIDSLHISDSIIQAVIQNEKEELDRRERLYRKGKSALSLEAKTVILVDDGIATGATMIAALQAITEQNAAEIIIAVPVAAFSTCEAIVAKASQFFCLLKPVDFYAVGLWYNDFSQTSDEEVAELLQNAKRRFVK